VKFDYFLDVCEKKLGICGNGKNLRNSWNWKKIFLGEKKGNFYWKIKRKTLEICGKKFVFWQTKI
jgi:hypothetical protein